MASTAKTPKRSRTTKGKRAAQQSRAVAQDAAQNHVPEWAEDIEHTLRRINAEKQTRRDRDPGLYR